MLISAVSYLNTLPFIYGITHTSASLLDSLQLCVPSLCAELAHSGQADISLIPVASLPSTQKSNHNTHIITDFCISAEGSVESVSLLTNSPLEDIDTIYTDNDSRTSVQLARILAQEKWHISPKWIEGLPYLELDTNSASKSTLSPHTLSPLSPGEAILAIGDKVFSFKEHFLYDIDLALEWQNHTALPFVFAVWVSCSNKGLDMSQELNTALSYGVNHIEDTINYFNPSNPNAYQYLTQNIKFNLTTEKHLSIHLFLDKIKQHKLI